MIQPEWYELIKWWGPIIGFGSLIVRAYFTTKKSISGWMNTLLHNHLSHIQDASAETVAETKKTNLLLGEAAFKNMEVAKKVEVVKEALEDHNEKEMQVWSGVLNTLTVLEDRTRRATPRRRR